MWALEVETREATGPDTDRVIRHWEESSLCKSGWGSQATEMLHTVHEQPVHQGLFIYVVIKKKKSATEKKGNWERVSWFGPGREHLLRCGQFRDGEGAQRGGQPRHQSCKVTFACPEASGGQGRDLKPCWKEQLVAPSSPVLNEAVASPGVRWRWRAGEGRALPQTHRTEVQQPNYLIVCTRHRLQQKQSWVSARSF